MHVLKKSIFTLITIAKFVYVSCIPTIIIRLLDGSSKFGVEVIVLACGREGGG